ncbi:hypothetical protein BJY00DRAFT_319995 [Aspergillus carlsbadensis]|nr:hypothetical protein BJY00DRAFT_319995 [Aspergillus carlsbadensis]
MEVDVFETMTADYSVDIEELYKISEKCQNDRDAYGQTIKINGFSYRFFEAHTLEDSQPSIQLQQNSLTSKQPPPTAIIMHFTLILSALLAATASAASFRRQARPTTPELRISRLTPCGTRREDTWVMALESEDQCSGQELGLVSMSPLRAAESGLCGLGSLTIEGYDGELRFTGCSQSPGYPEPAGLPTGVMVNNVQELRCESIEPASNECATRCVSEGARTQRMTTQMRCRRMEDI